jgi:hypothetical protein
MLSEGKLKATSEEEKRLGSLIHSVDTTFTLISLAFWSYPWGVLPSYILLTTTQSTVGKWG